LLLQVPDSAFCNPVLPVRVDAAIGNALVFLGKPFFPCVVDEATIVGMIVSYFDSPLPGI
jgi:hypothetical protein